MSHLRIALCGIEHPHSSEWYDALARVPELEPVAHYDPRPGLSLDSLPEPYAGLPCYDDLFVLLTEQQVEAALVIQPLPDAEETMVNLARAGVHILAEKPVARTANALKRVQAEMQPGTVFYTGYLWRLDPVIQQVCTLVEQGILGELWSIEMHWVTSKVGRRPGGMAHRDPRSYLFRAEQSRGGMLQWLGCHFVDVMLYLAGQPVKSVAAMMARQTTDEIEVEDTATCLLRFGNEMLGSLHVGYLLPNGGHQFLGLRGSLGWVNCEWEGGRRFTVYSDHPEWKAAPQRDIQFSLPADAGYGNGTAVILLHDFVRCIRQGGAGPFYTIGDAIRVLEVLDAAYESASQGCTVDQ